MVITHRSPGAQNMIAVDPATGKQIEHVKSLDPEAGWIEVWCTYEAHPDHKSVWLQDGKTVEKDFMLLRMTDFAGSTTYMSRMDYRDFDVVNKFTGEVLYEGRQKYNDPCYLCTGGQHCGSCKCCTWSDTRRTTSSEPSEESPDASCPEPTSARTF